MDKAKYAIVGNPISHSLSPKIHHYFAEITQRHISYLAIAISPEEFKPFTETLFTSLNGINITAPFKQVALELADQIHPRAVYAQATNTLINDHGTIIADNTDGIGLVTDLVLNHKINLHQQRILIIGAGGAAHGILPALAYFCPSAITITHRRNNSVLSP